MIDVSTVVFDLDQTLIDRQRAWDEWISNVDLDACDRVRLRGLDQNGYGNREAFFSAFESITGHRMAHQYFVQSLIRFVLPDRSLIRGLLRLGTTHTIAVLTNGGVWTQRAKIEALSLDEVFPNEHIFISESIGFAKPDRRAFDFVTETLGRHPSECLYVGDSIPNDIRAAKDAGWKAMQVRGPDDLMRKLSTRFSVCRHGVGEPKVHVSHCNEATPC